MANLYLQEIQQSLLSQLENLNNSFAKLKQRFTAVLVCQYFHLNIKVKDIGMTILEYNRLCSLILSSIVPFYVAIVCYMFYVVSIAKVRFFVKVFYLYAVIVCETFLFILIWLCSGVVSNFGRIRKQNERFFLALNFKTKNKGVISLINMQKVHALQDRQLLKPYSFKIAGDYRITPKTNYLVFVIDFKVFILQKMI